jgi:hypothetical protein
VKKDKKTKKNLLTDNKGLEFDLKVAAVKFVRVERLFVFVLTGASATLTHSSLIRPTYSTQVVLNILAHWLQL